VGAREKLNLIHILGAIGIAGALGFVTGSWTVAAITAVVIVGLSLDEGDIRLKGRR
jgi:H+/gluconate symporter-like permease